MELIQFVPSNVHGLCLRGMAAGVACLAFMSNLASAAQEVAPAVKAQVQSSYGKLPLSFEANQGQANAQVKFLSKGHGYALFLTPSEAVLSLKKPQAQEKAAPVSLKSSPSSTAPEGSGTVLRMQLVGGNPEPKIIGKEALPGKVNYLIGKDQGKWHTGIPTYGKVAYEGIYPGVDLVYYGNQGQLEYDFVVAPGADPGKVKLLFRGADKIEVNPAGELVLRAASGEIRMHKPVVYQEVNGIRKPIEGSYLLKYGQEVGFQVAAYDAERTLVIDPVLVYSTYLGGSGEDDGLGIAVDKWGQAYVTGDTGSSNFPTVNALQLAIGGDRDAFVIKLTADGAALSYSTYFGGSRSEDGLGIAVDKQGQAYVTGNTESSDFPTKNALQPTFSGGIWDAFVAQLTADGAALRYSTYLGGSGSDQGNGIVVGERGQAYVTGNSDSSDFPTKNALQPAIGGNFDAFVAQLTADGAALRYSTYLGGSSNDSGTGIAVDKRGQAYVIGNTESSDFPTKNALQPTFGGIGDAFVAQLTADGAALRYSTYLGGGSNDSGTGIAVDKRGQAYVVGSTLSSDFPTKNALQPAIGGNFDAFVAQLTADGAALRYSTYLGGNSFEVGHGIAVDKQDQAYVIGNTESSDFPTKNALQPTFGGIDDAFVAQLTADGAALRYSTYLGGSGSDQGNGIVVRERGQAYVTGNSNSSDFPTKNALQPTFGGGFFDVFVAKIGSDERHCAHKKKCEDDREDHGHDKHGDLGSKN
jgi:hypothetical protein